ncbi:MAG: acetamidase/formamidase family protein [Candidatus Heteroscillospira sp.]|jgi:amidase
MKILSRENSFYSFEKGLECKLTVEQGERFKVETYDCRGGRLQRHDQLLTTAPDWNSAQPKTNPCTGPVAVKGVNAGDTVRIDIHRIDLETRGFVLQKTDMGICKQFVDKDQVVFAEIQGEEIRLECGIALPIRPHIGTLGVTPLDAAATGFAGKHGGNMDCRQLEPGAALYLPAQICGGAIGVGDVHASMGSGELMGTGIEIGATVELSVACVADIRVTGPVVCTQNTVITIGSAPQLQEALETASSSMLELLERYGGYSRTAALSLLTAICDAGICQGFDTDMFSVASVSIPHKYLPMFQSAERKYI